MRVVLISTYELGHQPFGIASPAAWLADAGADVTCLDLSREELREDAILRADLIAFYLPMHTATRLAIALVPRVRQLNPKAHVCFFGLYAPINERHLREVGAETILGGEFEEGLRNLVQRLSEGATPAKNNGRSPSVNSSPQSEPVISLARQTFLPPLRDGLPSLTRYGKVILADGSTRIAGYTEASRGCKHLCRHCPIVPVYNGVFRVVNREVVLADIRQQVAAGAEHITFGDADFFNGPAHAIAIVERMHREFPSLSFDATIKIEHLQLHRKLLAKLPENGCLFITSAVESVDDRILECLDKGHTRSDFVAVAQSFKELGLTLLPTFVPFTPWTTLEGYCHLLQLIAENDLVQNVAPIQLAIRLLIPASSRLLELEEIRSGVEAFDSGALVYPWRHADRRVDALASEIRKIVERGEKFSRTRPQIFENITRAAWSAANRFDAAPQPGRSTPVPHFSEAWYCCAEPTGEQFVSIKQSSAIAGAEKYV